MSMVQDILTKAISDLERNLAHANQHAADCQQQYDSTTEELREGVIRANANCADLRDRLYDLRREAAVLGVKVK
jgi:hypothetical protein